MYKDCVKRDQEFRLQHLSLWTYEQNFTQNCYRFTVDKRITFSCNTCIFIFILVYEGLQILNLNYYQVDISTHKKSYWQKNEESLCKEDNIENLGFK